MLFRGPKRGNDLQTTLTLDFMEAVTGCNREISVQSLSHCNTCQGTGNKPGTTAKTCKQCNGSGMVSSIVTAHATVRHHSWCIVSG